MYQILSQLAVFYRRYDKNILVYFTGSQCIELMEWMLRPFDLIWSGLPSPISCVFTKFQYFLVMVRAIK